MKSACIYARVSTSGQEEKGTSLESQVASCINFAEQNGYVVTRIVQETHTGADLFERRQLSSLRDEVRQNRYDAIISHAIDRLSRDTAHLIIIANECDRFNTNLLFVTEDLDKTAEGKLMQSVKGYVAEIERQKIKERSMRGKRTKAENGNLSFGHIVYGYAIDRATKRRVVVESEADIIRSLFNGMVNGRSMRSLATDLDRNGIPSPERGAYWTQATVRRILKNPAYAGITYAFRYKRVSFNKNGRKISYNVERDKSEWVRQSDDITPAIISPELFDRVQTIIEDNKKRKRRAPVLQFLLRGLITCETCGRTYTTNTGRNWRSYVCDSRRSPILRCGNKTLAAQKAEDLIWKQISDILRRPDVAIQKLENAHKSSKTRREKLVSEATNVQQSIDKIEAEVKRLIGRAASVSDDIWNLMQDQIAARQNEIARLREIKLQSENAIIDFDSHAFDFHSMREFCDGVKNQLDEMEFADRVKVLTALNVRIKWNGERLKVFVSTDPLPVLLNQPH